MTATLKHKNVNRRMLAVDYPKQNEVVSSGHYTVRVFAPAGAHKVGISVDQGPWRSCRPSVGFWWYDWSGYGNGEHEVVVSMSTREGKRIISEPHEFFVQLESKRPAE